MLSWYKGIAWDEYDKFCKTLSGPCCVRIWNGDYDFAIIWPDGLAVNIDRYHPDVPLDVIYRLEK